LCAIDYRDEGDCDLYWIAWLFPSKNKYMLSFESGGLYLGFKMDN